MIDKKVEKQMYYIIQYNRYIIRIFMDNHDETPDEFIKKTCMKINVENIVCDNDEIDIIRIDYTILLFTLDEFIVQLHKKFGNSTYIDNDIAIITFELLMKIITTGDIEITNETNEFETMFRCAINSGVRQEPLCEISHDTNIVFCGDIHGSLRSLICHFLIMEGFKNEQKYVFLGDYLDRGTRSLEVFSVLILMRALFPTNIYLLCGNHETRAVYLLYGTVAELQQKNMNMTMIDINNCCDMIDELVNSMSHAIIVGGKIFGTHGCPSEKTPMDKIRNEKMKLSDPSSPTYNLVWSDPSDEELYSDIEYLNLTSTPNTRGAGMLVPYEITKKFITDNSLELIIRAHQCVAKGYMVNHGHFVITVFGQPNYCGTRNDAGMINISPNGEKTIKVFNHESDVYKSLPPSYDKIANNNYPKFFL